MAGRKVLAITERQFAVLRVLWGHGPLTARALMQFLPRGERQPYTSVLGLLQLMEKEGLVDHEKQGAAHVYRAAVSRQEGTGNLLSDFLAKFFYGSAEQLIVGLVDGKRLTPDELSEIQARVAARQGAGVDGTKSGAGKRRKTP